MDYLFTLILFLSTSTFAAEIVKNSKSGICHDKYSSSHIRTKNFTSHDSMDACISSGGRLPANYKGPAIQPQRVTNNASQNVPEDPYSKLYDRKQWKHWIDTDKDCQNTRAELLISQSKTPVTFRSDKKCSVIKGSWGDPFSGKTWTKASDVDIDHIVPLKWANGHGGSNWFKKRKTEFANDFENLLVVEDNLNQSKGAQGPDEWMPPNHSYRCEYLKKFDYVVKKCSLSYVVSEKRVIRKMMKVCNS